MRRIWGRKQEGGFVDIYHVSELSKWRPTIIERLAKGQVAILPTDTLYGLTADASHHDAVERILAIKQRRTPVSCIPRSAEWACSLIHSSHQELFQTRIAEYFGPYTTLWPASPSAALHPLVQTEQLIGIRFPSHWIRDLASEAGLTLTTTSVNRTGQTAMSSLETLDPELMPLIDFLVDAGPLNNPPSTMVHCYKPDFEQRARQ